MIFIVLGMKVYKSCRIIDWLVKTTLHIDTAQNCTKGNKAAIFWVSLKGLRKNILQSYIPFLLSLEQHLNAYRKFLYDGFLPHVIFILAIFSMPVKLMCFQLVLDKADDNGQWTQVVLWF